jgi:hypothetical protein
LVYRIKINEGKVSIDRESFKTGVNSHQSSLSFALDHECIFQINNNKLCTTSLDGGLQPLMSIDQHQLLSLRSFDFLGFRHQWPKTKVQTMMVLLISNFANSQDKDKG